MAVNEFIHSGLLREVIKFEKNFPNAEDGGGESDSYTEFLVCRGKMRQQGQGNRGAEAGEVLLNNRYILTVRYQAALANELNGEGTIRILYNGSKYTIASWQYHDERFRYIVFNLNTQHI